jgi:hypothetical protein
MTVGGGGFAALVDSSVRADAAKLSRVRAVRMILKNRPEMAKPIGKCLPSKWPPQHVQMVARQRAPK